jgi:drug/metabolite transporter (DMT)-like permease
MNANRLTVAQIALLAAYAIGMSGGQVLFKLAADVAGDRIGVPIGRQFLLLFCNLYFLLAVVLYAALAPLWVWILSFTPLSRAYPFVALAFVLTPLCGAALFDETISPGLVAGLGFILFGLFLVVA